MPYSERPTLLLTGGSRGLGHAIGGKFGAEGWEIIAPPRLRLELSSPAAIQDYIETEIQRFGPIVNSFIHSAGINPSVAKLTVTELGVKSPGIDVALNEFDQVVQVNARSFLQLSIGLLRRKQEMDTLSGLRMLALSSLFGGDITRIGKMPFSASKAMLEKIVKQLAVEWGRHGVLVNAIEPGFFPTEMTQINLGEEKIRMIEAQTPLGRLGEPHELANAAYFLCSPQNTFITGVVLPVDGGFLAGGGLGVLEMAK
ncbi:SDR family oxidoreductase [Candidatus Roizmanbacteria bacterium]|nr:SDR family oxidoreductase [Candidatus Roizmanbacteria bacterium]